MELDGRHGRDTWVTGAGERLPFCWPSLEACRPGERTLLRVPEAGFFAMPE